MKCYGIDVQHQRHEYMLEDNGYISGGEGSLHQVKGFPQYVAKIYRPNKADSVRRKKIEYMVSIGAGLPTGTAAVHFAWPQETLFDTNGMFVGFLMEKAVSETNVAELCCGSDSPGDYWHINVGVAANLALAVKKAHELNIILGDMNGKNYLLGKNGYVTIVDNDSFVLRDGQGRQFLCNACIPELLPPELQGRPRLDYTFETDDFSLAIHIFMLLMNGAHPYTARKVAVQSSSSGVIRQVDAIKNCQSCFFLTANISSQLPQGTPSLSFLPEEIQQLFYQAFITGHQNPQNRPTAAQWYDALFRLNQMIIHCSAPGSKHAYPSNNTGCPWCAISPVHPPVSRLQNHPQNQPQPSPVPEPKAGKKWLWLVALLLIGLAVWTVGSGGGGKPQDDDAAVKSISVSSPLSVESQTNTAVMYTNPPVITPEPEPISVYPQVGDIVLFGSYEQDGRSNGTEAVEWMVLENDSQRNRVLLLSRYILDKQRYNSKYTNVSWAKCSLRNWLNNSFYNECFNSEEKRAIVASKLRTPYVWETVETTDSVFCLSAEETRTYLSRAERKCEATAYAVKNKVVIAGIYGYWSLRGATGQRTNDYDRVSPEGKIEEYGSNTNADGVGVRPAIWVDADYFQ